MRFSSLNLHHIEKVIVSEEEYEGAEWTQFTFFDRDGDKWHLSCFNITADDIYGDQRARIHELECEVRDLKASLSRPNYELKKEIRELKAALKEQPEMLTMAQWRERWAKESKELWEKIDESIDTD